jgi:hypothetical protein
MDRIKQWWANDLPAVIKGIFLLLGSIGVPAFIILMTIPDRTETFFVWTVKPVLNARLMGVMYGNALLLVLLGIAQTSWARVRIVMLAITVFSLLATTLTFFYLKPFLAHPWFHLAFWLSMYFVLFFAAPYVFLTYEKLEGGRLPVRIPLNSLTRLVAGGSLLVGFVTGLGLLFRIDLVNQYWPWTMPPLVGGLIGVLFITHTACYAWALWDGDWLRGRPIFQQGPITGLLFLLLPLVHPGDLRVDAGSSLVLYNVVSGLVLLANLAVLLSYRRTRKAVGQGA